jgi:hypothetical protein
MMQWCRSSPRIEDSAAGCAVISQECVMERPKSFVGLVAGSCLALSACLPDIFTDAATRIAYEVESRVGSLGTAEGARYSIDRVTPQTASECRGAYKAQFDKVGALIVWCYDEAGKVLNSGSTSYIARFIDMPQTWIVDKAAGTTLTIELERRGARVVVTAVR